MDRWRLSWSAPSGTVHSYTVKRGINPGGPYPTTVASPSGTSANDASAAPGLTYYYVVTATNGGGESPPATRPASPCGRRHRPA